MHIDVNRELDRLLTADQHDPFQVLGCQVVNREPLTLVIRTFQPRAKSVRLVLGDERREMYRMRDDGLFEILLADTGIPEEYLFEVILLDGTTRFLHDPYQFPVQLSEFDRYLFGNGTHYELYNKMGAHPTVLNGVAGVIFRVWAPTARRVSVIGDFNDWDGRVHQMRCMGTSGIWELFLPGLAQGKSYKFEIKTQDGLLLEKADPFQFHAELRPKTASVIWNLDYLWHDEAWLAARDRCAIYSQPLSIYTVHAGSWQRDPANPGRFLIFRELTEKLIPYVKEMGFTHIELLPIMEDGHDDSGEFQVSGYFAPSSYFGTPQELMGLIDSCHQNGLGVILAWAPGNLSTNGHGLSRFDGTSLFEEAGQGEHPGGQRLAFRFQKKEVANFLIASGLFWLDKYHADGIRVGGVTTMLYRNGPADPRPPSCEVEPENPEAIEFFRRLNEVAAKRCPGAIVIADEGSRFFGTTRGLDAGGLGFDFKWNEEWVGESLRYFCIEPRLRKFHHNAVAQSWPDAWAERSILALSNRQVIRSKGSLLAQMQGDEWQRFANLRLLLLLLWCQPGKKLLFMGAEFGQLSEWAGRMSLDWQLIEKNGLHRQLWLFVRELNHFYLAQPSLWENDYSGGGRQWLVRGDAENSIIVFSRHGQAIGDHLVCLLNFTPAVHYDYKMGVPFGIRYREVLGSDEERFGGSNVCNPHLKEPFAEPVAEAPCHVRVSVPPLGGLILQPASAHPGIHGTGTADGA